MLILLLLSATVLIYITTKKNGLINNNDSDNIFDSSLDEKLKRKFYNVIYSILSTFYYTSITPSMVLATIKMESGTKALKMKNSEIIGDKNRVKKAYGIMQIRQPALTDVNNHFNFHYSIIDVKNDYYTNLIVGIGYLELCYTAAGTIYPNDKEKRAWLMYKKYNGGVGSLPLAINSSVKYANVSLSYYNKFKKMV